MSRLAAVVVVLLAVSGSVRAESQSIEQIIATIDTPRDVAVEFSEQRMNPLLAEPMQLTGVVEFSSAGTLSKRVKYPIDETISISAKEVLLERSGRKRMFRMRPGTELWEFYVSLRAVLAGDIAGISDKYVLKLLESGETWVVKFQPANPLVQKALPTMIVTGRDDRIHKVRTEQGENNWQIISFKNSAGR